MTNDTNQPENFYKTKDLAEAAALMVKNRQLVKVERERGVCWFIFENDGECQQLSRDYFFGELLVNASDYQESLRKLKNLIFSER